jgi:integrase
VFGQLIKAIREWTAGKEVTRIALQLLALTYVRPGELLGAQWSEFTLDGAEPSWVIPAERMKLRREHVVALSTQAVALLTRLKELTGHTGTVITFNGGKIADAKTFRNALAALGYTGKQDPHGFRVSASTLLHEQGHNSDVIEMSLAHVVPGVKGIYNRSHLLPQRRELAQAWADYIDKIANQ